MSIHDIREKLGAVEALKAVEFYVLRKSGNGSAALHCRIWDQLLTLRERELEQIAGELNAAMASVIDRWARKLTIECQGQFNIAIAGHADPLCPCNNRVMIPVSNGWWCPHMEQPEDVDIERRIQWEEANNLPDYLRKFRPAAEEPQ